MYGTLETTLFHRLFLLALAMAAYVFSGCSEAARNPQAISLLGEPLYESSLPTDSLEELESKLAAAKSAWEEDRDDEQGIIWYGRRTAYLGKYREAIEIFTEGLARHPDSFKLLRHRGHRFITVREFERAVEDLTRAADLIEGLPDEVEPDGLPNQWNIPTSTSHTNIFYHLGLAHYLLGDFEKARGAFEKCLEFSANDDMRCAVSHWLYMTYRRLRLSELARDLIAPIHERMKILENTQYHRLLLMYKGSEGPDDLIGKNEQNTSVLDLDQATSGYGLGNWYLYSDDVDRARQIFEQVIEGRHWAAFGYIAAEAELARMD